MIRVITQAATSLLHRASLYRQSLYPQLSLVGGLQIPQSSLDTTNNNNAPTIMDALWLAVPKKRVSKSKKRMKTTVQKRVKAKNHIMVDGRTGELTLRHCLPANWKDYLPEDGAKWEGK